MKDDDDDDDDDDAADDDDDTKVSLTCVFLILRSAENLLLCSSCTMLCSMTV
jgi:hypothetical protein